MNGKQKFIKAIYPFFKGFTKIFKVNAKHLHSKTKAITSVYDLQIEVNNGTVLPVASLKGKKILFVNTASDCGYTPQYEGLQALHIKYQHKVAIIAFPSNDFKEQEKGADSEIEQFCKVNFGLTFPLMKKTVVKKLAGQHEVFNWLSNPSLNGWNSEAPNWNFCKYVVDENGNLIHFFQSGVEPLSKELIDAIEQ
jgi:glutathione peroxidase